MMSLINSIANKFCSGRLRQIDRFRAHPGMVQEEVWADLLLSARDTEWGKRYGFAGICSIREFQQRLPLQTYEDAKSGIDRMRSGEPDVLWPGRTRWFAKSSGTTENKSKFIPVTDECLRFSHFRGGRDVMALYLDRHPNSHLLTGKTLTLGGSHQIDSYENHTAYGDLSAVMIQNVPSWVNLLRTPPTKVALLSDFQRKIEKIAETAVRQRVVSFAGVPSWYLVLLKHILELTGKRNILEVWPDMELFIHGGVSFVPYREQYRQLFPSEGMHYFETYNASEGFFALQDEPSSDSMLLMLDYRTFYEFIPMERLGDSSFTPLTIEEVTTGVNYAMVITTNSGLWRYLIGDTVVFTSLFPHKIKISGRTKAFINAFGEEIIVDNAEKALHEACRTTGASIVEYTAGPVYMDSSHNGAHEWLIEFSQAPDSLERFTKVLDTTLCSLNSDYEAKRSNDITLRMPIVRNLPKDAFYQWMQRNGKLGGQNKVPRLCNDRRYLDSILEQIESRDKQ